MLTTSKITALRALLARETSAAAGPAPAFQDRADAGDIVQIRRTPKGYPTEPTFGGMLVQVTAATPAELRGSLLRPRRGGCRDAWLRLKHGQLERVGRSFWPDPNLRAVARGAGPLSSR